MCVSVCVSLTVHVSMCLCVAPLCFFCSQLLSGAIYQVQKDLEQMVQQQVEPGR